MTRRGGWPTTGFGERLRTLRENAGMSQQSLAELAGCHRFTVAKMERGEQEPAWPLVLALAKALGVDCTAFTDGEVEESAPQALPRAPGRSAGGARVGRGKASDKSKERSKRNE